MQHESGAEGWAKEFLVVMVLFSGLLLVSALRHTH
jgi:hypothetical protein